MHNTKYVTQLWIHEIEILQQQHELWERTDLRHAENLPITNTIDPSRPEQAEVSKHYLQMQSHDTENVSYSHVRGTLFKFVE